MELNLNFDACFPHKFVISRKWWYWPLFFFQKTKTKTRGIQDKATNKDNIRKLSKTKTHTKAQRQRQRWYLPLFLFPKLASALQPYCLEVSRCQRTNLKSRGCYVWSGDQFLHNKQTSQPWNWEVEVLKKHYLLSRNVGGLLISFKISSFWKSDWSLLALVSSSDCADFIRLEILPHGNMLHLKFSRKIRGKEQVPQATSTDVVIKTLPCFFVDKRDILGAKCNEWDARLGRANTQYPGW